MRGRFRRLLMWQKVTVLAVVAVLFLAGSCLACSELVHVILPGATYTKAQQIQLAHILGVDESLVDEDFGFPYLHFYRNLEIGMTPKEVHEIVRGYKAVYRCETYGEVYYFYSRKHYKALRFEVLFDNQGKFWMIRGEDSARISMEGCVPGRQPE